MGKTLFNKTSGNFLLIAFGFFIIAAISATEVTKIQVNKLGRI